MKPLYRALFQAGRHPWTVAGRRKPVRGAQRLRSGGLSVPDVGRRTPWRPAAGRGAGGGCRGEGVGRVCAGARPGGGGVIELAGRAGKVSARVRGIGEERVYTCTGLLVVGVNRLVE